MKKKLKILLVLKMIVLLPLLTYSQNTLPPTWKPTLQGDSVILIKKKVFKVFTVAFIKGENALQREGVYKEKIRSDSLYVDWLEDTANKAAKVITDLKQEMKEVKDDAKEQLANKDKECKEDKSKLDKQFRKQKTLTAVGTITGLVTGVFATLFITR